MQTSESTIFVVDDDPSMRNAIRNLLRSAGLEPQLFASAEEFLEADRPDVPGCLILDVRLPGLSGLDLQRHLSISNTDVPIIFITAHGNDQMSVRAIQEGAVAFLTKPFRDQDLLDAIQIAVKMDRLRRERTCVDER